MSKNILVRDCLEDTGVIPSPAYPYRSPDVICHAEVQDPQTEFKNNYDQDPNTPVEFGSPNFFYVRAKNTDIQTASAYMSVFWTPASLLMSPQSWINNKMTVQKGTAYVDYIELLNVAPNQIVVGNDYFTWSPPSMDHTCLIGVVSRTTIPEVPPSFDSNYTFVDWVRNNKNVCWRNLTIVNQYPDAQYIVTYKFGNLDSQSVNLFFKVTASNNIPDGTTIVIKNDQIGLNQQTKIDSTNPNTRIIMSGGVCPPKFTGSLVISAYLPNGAKWPQAGQVTTEAWIASSQTEKISKYGTHIKNLGVTDHHLARLPKHLSNSITNGGLLVQLGNCAYQFNFSANSK